MANDQKKLLYLESIRGAAALVVVFDHLILAFRPDLATPNAPGLESALPATQFFVRSPLAFIYNGSFAVAVFFTLSGFVLSYSYFSRKSDALTSQSLRRYFRLAFPSLISVVISYLLLKNGLYFNAQVGTINHSDWLQSWFNFNPSLWVLRENGAIYQGLYGIFVGQSIGYNNVLWTMRIELIGSFLIYGILSLFGRINRRWIIYTLACALLLITAHTEYVGFIFGLAMCDWYCLKNRSNIDIRWAGWLILVLGIALGGYRGVALPLLHRRIAGDSYHTLIAAALVIIAPLLSSSVRYLLRLSPMVFLGRISFGLYLIHVPVICSAGCWIFQRSLERGWGQISSFWFAALISVFLSVILGWLLYHIADRPSIWIGKKFAAIFKTP